ncbi:MAG: isochorismatase family cysteine hydrolase, partial [Burkholderiaceae bacterium]
VPHDASIALLIIDMISDFEFKNGQKLLKLALPAARNIVRLKKRARASRIPTVYVNDNFGQWRSDFRQLVQRCLHDGVRGEPVARLLAPDDEDYFVLKPANSAFYATPLEKLLKLMGVKTLVLTGVASHQCILFTAVDAYVRDYRLIVPRDCVAAPDKKDSDLAVRYFKSELKADVRSSARIRLSNARKRT